MIVFMPTVCFGLGISLYVRIDVASPPVVKFTEDPLGGAKDAAVQPGVSRSLLEKDDAAGESLDIGDSERNRRNGYGGPHCQDKKTVDL